MVISDKTSDKTNDETSDAATTTMTTATATMALTSSTKTGTTCNQTDFASRQSTTPILATMNIILDQVSKSATVEIPLTTSAVLTVQDQAQTDAISPLTSMTDFNETIRKRKWDAMHQASLETIAVSNNQKLRGRGEILTNKGEGGGEARPKVGEALPTPYVSPRGPVGPPHVFPGGPVGVSEVGQPSNNAGQQDGAVKNGLEEAKARGQIGPGHGIMPAVIALTTAEEEQNDPIGAGMPIPCADPQQKICGAITNEQTMIDQTANKTIDMSCAVVKDAQRGQDGGSSSIPNVTKGIIEQEEQSSFGGLHEHASEDANIARTDTPCNIDQAQPTQPKLEDWEEAFRHEPLKSVKLDALKTQRSKHEVIQIAKFLIDYRHVLSDGTLDYWHNPPPTHGTACDIKTTQENPRIVSSNRPFSPDDRAEFNKQVTDRLKEGVIEPSPPWCSNAVLMRKDGKIRMAIDYRQLNKITV